MKSFALSFKGGLARGFGGLGVLKYLQENNLKPSIYAGSSAGGIVAAAGALELDLDQIQERLKEFKFSRIFGIRSALFRGSIVNQEDYRRVFLSFTEGKDLNIEELPNKLVLFATNPATAERAFIEKGSLVEGLLASSAYPGIFPIIKVSAYHKELIDGDLSLSYSPEYLKNLGVEKVMGIRFKRGVSKNRIHKSILNRAFISLRIISAELEHIDNLEHPVDLEIQYHTKSKSNFDFRNIDYSIKSAYSACKEHHEEILKTLGIKQESLAK